MRMPLSNTEKLKLTAPIGALRSRLQVIWNEDKRAERMAERGCNVSCVGIMMAIVMFIRLCSLDGDTPSARFFIVGVGILSVIVGGYFVNSHHSHNNLDDHKQKLAQKLLKFLAADLNPDKPCQLYIDFDMCESRESEFDQQWFAFRGTLKDGSIVVLSLSRKGRKTQKSKSKGLAVRIRLFEKLKLEVRPAARRYANLGNVPERLKTDWSTSKLSRVQLFGRGLRLHLRREPGTIRTYRGSTLNLTEQALFQPAEVTRQLVRVFYALKLAKLDLLSRPSAKQ